MCRNQLAPEEEKFCTREENLAAMDEAYHNGYREGASETGSDWYQSDIQIRAQHEQELERVANQWRESLDFEVQRNYELGIVEGRSIANEEIKALKQRVEKLCALLDGRENKSNL